MRALKINKDGGLRKRCRFHRRVTYSYRFFAHITNPGVFLTPQQRKEESPNDEL